MQKEYGRVIWITGLSGSGKTTLALELIEMMKKTLEPVIHLDGDKLRAIFNADQSKPKNYDRNRRLALAMQYSNLSKLLSSQGITVVISTISMFNEIYTWNKINLPNYFEVYLKIPIDELRRRDPKNIYNLYDKGIIKNVAGIDLPVDEPLNADWQPEFQYDRSVLSLVSELHSLLEEKISNSKNRTKMFY
jgi:cytidine diphosphoramidate kinase